MDNDTAKEEHKGCYEEEWEEWEDLIQLPSLKALHPPFPFHCAEIRHGELPQLIAELPEPHLDEHRQNCVDYNADKAGGQERVLCQGVLGECELGGCICGNG